MLIAFVIFIRDYRLGQTLISCVFHVLYVLQGIVVRIIGMAAMCHVGGGGVWKSIFTCYLCYLCSDWLIHLNN